MREQGTGRSTTLAQHIIQSFAPGEVTPEEALAIGSELCERYLKDQYQYVLAVHTDHEHLHCHIVFNNTNLYTHRTFETEENQGGKAYRAWAKLRAISDEICKEHGISVIEQPKAKGKSHFEWEMEKVGKSWKAKLRQALRELISYSKSFDDFLQKCVENGIEYDYKPQNKVKLKFRFKDEGQQRFTRADTLGAEFEPEAIIETIETAQKKAADELAEKYLAARRARQNAEVALRNHTAVANQPKTEQKQTTTATTEQQPTVTAPTKPTEYGHLITNAVLEKMKERGIAQAPAPKPTEGKTNTAKQDYVYKPTSDEEFFNAFGVHLDEADTPDTTAPTESRAPEVEEVDPWEEIRSMGKADEIIADLEEGGIESVAELRGFFYAGKHDDDHTKELTELKKKIIAIDTLVEKMKHRDELAPIYKEYESKSGWAKSRFKKKNASQIADYEETVAYIKEHRKPFIVDGKAPSIKMLEQKSKDLKEEFNALLPEHNAFVAKRNAADKHKKKVRKYLDDQMVKRHNEKSRQRSIEQQRKKNYLE